MSVTDLRVCSLSELFELAINAASAMVVGTMSLEHRDSRIVLGREERPDSLLERIREEVQRRERLSQTAA